MNLSELQDYGNWVGESAKTILRAVIKNGGWELVFPLMVEPWASRVRNFFNLTPNYLTRLDFPSSFRLIKRHHKNHEGLARFALSGDVYEDETGRIWFEMHTAGAAYHYEGDVDWNKAKGVVLPQAFIPVFKLVSPDGTGGSCEVCIHNWQNYKALGFKKGKRYIGKIGQRVSIRSKVVINSVYQGSYNYSETIVKGRTAHELRDVIPHKEDEGFYINPPRYSALEKRIFREI